ncbi:MAG TPA: C25 family cysteine peptidase [Candidatus Krumholzibacteria bacterium]
MRSPTLLIAVVVGLCGSAWLTLRAIPNHIDVSVATAPADVRLSVAGGVASFESVKGAAEPLSIATDPGRPAVPVRIVSVLLPPDHDAGDVEATGEHPVVLATGVTVRRAELPIPDPDADRPMAAPMSSMTAGDDAPGFARYLGTGTWHGYRIASYEVHPVQIEGDRVVLYRDVRLSVATVAVAPAAPAMRAGRATARRVDGIRDAVGRLVANADEIDAYAPIAVSEQAGPFQPSSVPSLEGSPVDYVIITTASMAAAFDSLAEWKTQKGVATVVKTVEWIEANYPRGADRAETVRFFIRDAYQKWGVQWVLLAADTQDIPARYLYSTYYYGGTNIASDLYFAAVDGDFNANHNARFGEQPADSPDLYAEVNLGRLPVSTPGAASTIVGKIIRYETPANVAYHDKVLYLGEVIFPAPWSAPMPIVQNGASNLEYISPWVTSPSRRITRMYETEWLFPGSVHESRANAIDSLNAGYNQVFFVGHGYRFNMHCGDDNIAIPDADALNHPNEFFNLYQLNCTSSAFDYDCLSEHMLRNSNGGAVSVVGATNSAFPDIATYYMEDYAKQLYVSNETHVGAAFSLGRAVRTPLAFFGDNVDLWTHYVYVLLGDPEMPLWTTNPATPVVSHAVTKNAGTNGIGVNVTVGGQPKAGATVCLWKSGEDYQVQTTNASGQVSFAAFVTPTAGPIHVTVTATNMKRYDGVITVNAAAGAMPVVESMTVDDDNTGGTLGNSDGVIDAGEIVDLRPSVRNRGGSTSPALTATLALLTPSATLLDNTAAVPSLAAGATANASDSWRLQVNALASDEFVLDFNAALSSGGPVYNTPFSKVVHAPRLEVVSMRKNDQAPVGDGNGVVTNGEQYLLFAGIKNYGTGRADGITATLSALNGGSTVIDSIAAYSSVGHLAGGENLAGFRLSEADVSLGNPLRIVVTDSHGRTITRNIELREPLAPTLQTFDATLGVDKMGITWQAGASTDVKGYNIYRAPGQAGPYTRANADVIAHTVFVDAGLAPSTRYYYQVASVDQSGNEGARSAAAFASTNPPQLAGWPLELVDPSANSPVTGDIDGYGANEVVVGNDQLYAWHSNGDEVVDGDQQGVTWGVLSSQGSDFIGPAALVEIDGTPGFEIAAAAYSSKQVFCFQGDGTVMAGWPRPTVDLVRAGVVIGDIDGNGSPEIVAVDQEAYLYAWHANGTEVIDGDANPATDGVFKRLPDTDQWQYQMPALADIDNDGKEEIIIATQDKKLYVFNETGGNEPGWPLALPNYAGGGVAVGDVDNNGDLEIVVTVRSSGDVICLHHNGTELWHTWTNNNLFFNPSPSLADITGDGKLEAFVPASNGRLYAIQYDGSYAPGWPVYYSTKTYTESSAVIADINGDGSVDVLLGDEGRFINAWSSTGGLLDGFPLVLGDAVRGTPTVTDLDKDGKVDIVAVGYNQTVYAWALNAIYNPAKAPWPMYRGNVKHNGHHGVVVATGAGDTPTRHFETRLEQNYPNPFNPVTRIPYEIDGAPGRVTLAVYDVTGARVRTLVDRVLKPGIYSEVWDGRNERGETVSSGVYFYRLSTPSRALTRKMILLK